MAHLLLIEDDIETAEQVCGYLASHGHSIDHAIDGATGLDRARGRHADALLVDRMLPMLDGLTLIETLRQDGDQTPVLVLSALGAVDERVRGLRAGGDDYLVKPFALTELAARVDALLRRPAPSEKTVITAGPLTLDLMARVARRVGRDLELLPREFALLKYLVERAGQVVTRAMLFEDVWQYRFTPKSNLVDVHMSRLRRKLEQDGEPSLIASVRGIGFTFDAAA